MIRFRRYILFFMLCLSANVGLAQDEVHQVDIEEFESLNEEINFDKTKRSLQLRRKIEAKQRKEPKSNMDLGFLRGLGGLFNLLAYLVIAGLVIAIVYMIFSNVKLDRQLNIGDEVEAQLEEEHIEEIDLESEYEKALTAGNYRMALRMRFLTVLQFLSFENAIDWRFEKTNRDYAQELRSSQYHKSFRKLSNIFEWVWYGNTEIDKEQFEACIPEFDQFKKSSK